MKKQIDLTRNIILNPTIPQKLMLTKAFEAYKWVFNHFLALYSNTDPFYETKLFPAAAYSRMLTKLRQDVVLLHDTSSHIQQAAINDLSHKFCDVYFGKADRVLPLNHYSDYHIPVVGKSMSFGDKWVRFPKVGRIKHKHDVNDNLIVKRLHFLQPTINTFSVDFICKMEVEE